jgi:diguanylate cyclase (GGDEF)-like protein/PAS domain S-box-containing protein
LASLPPSQRKQFAEVMGRSDSQAESFALGMLELVDEEDGLSGKWVPQIRFIASGQMNGILVSKAERVLDAQYKSQVLYKGNKLGFDYVPDFTHQLSDGLGAKILYITINNNFFVTYLSRVTGYDGKDKYFFKMLSINDLLVRYASERNIELNSLSLVLDKHKRLVLIEGKPSNIPFVSSESDFKLSLNSVNIDVHYSVPISWSEKDTYYIVAFSFLACFFLVVILLLSNVMRQRKQQLISLSRKYGDLLDNSHQAVVLLTHTGIVTYWSRTAAELFGYTAHSVVDQSVDAFLFDDKTGHKLRNLSDYHDSFKIMSYLKSSTGDYVYCRVAVSYFLEYNEIVLTIEDNTKEYEDEKKIKRLAFYDGLTDLESRSYFCMHVAKLLESIKIEKGALFFLDLDGFKAVNDQMGHEAGDELLSIVANRLKQAVFQVSHDVHLSRFGGDEFVVFIYNAAVDVDSVYAVINKYVSAPILLSGVEVKIAISMGVALYPDHATGFDALLRNADIAMYEAKALGKNTYCVFNDSLIKKIHEKIQIRQKLANAIADNKLKIYYQPLVDVRTRAVYGAEALLRWHDEELGWISPGKFIPIAEEYGLIVELSRWVLKAAAEQLLLWEQDAVLSQIVVSVNIGPKELNNSSFVEFVFSIFNGKESLNNRLDIELTEYSLMSDIDAKLPLFNQLRSFGFGISIDDFGTGYSSLNYLKKLPITKLKIDRSFITDLHNNDDDAVIARTIISMSRSLGIKVVAEGVEIQSQWDLLEDAGCDYIQGYLYSKPIPLSEFEKLVKDSDISLKSTY